MLKNMDWEMSLWPMTPLCSHPMWGTKQRRKLMSYGRKTSTINVRMWVLKNLDSVFCYVQAMSLWTSIYQRKMTHSHVWNSNSTTIWNDGKIWMLELIVFWCNIWHKSKQSTPFSSIVWNVCSMFFVVAFVHFDGVTWQMVEWRTICLHCRWKRSRESPILQAWS